MHHIITMYGTNNMNSIHIYLYKHVVNDMDIYFSKEKRKNLNISKPTYLSNY